MKKMHGARGFSLIEVLVAMTIFSVGVLGLLGMYARAVTNFSDSKYRTDAALLADSLINDIWINRANITQYAYNGSTATATIQPWLSAVAAALPKGTAAVTVAGTQVQVQVFWQPPDAPVRHNHLEIATIQNP
jgi:type IV pilus assembly protein PilV